MARHQERRYPSGSISEGTMRPEDLIPEFLSELRYRMRERRIKGHAALYREIDKRSDAEGYYETEEADWDLEALFDALGEYAGPYFCFGAHPADGASAGTMRVLFSPRKRTGCLRILGRDTGPAYSSRPAKAVIVAMAVSNSGLSPYTMSRRNAA